LLQSHIVRTTGKLVQLKDLHNIKAVKTADGLTDWQSTLKHLEKLRTNDPGATIEVLTMNVLFYASICVLLFLVLSEQIV